MLIQEECEKALEDLTNWCDGGYFVYWQEYYEILQKLIKEHFEIVELLEKWGLSDLSIRELDEWRDRCIWHVKECEKLNDEFIKINDYYFKLEKAICSIFGVSADEVLEEYAKSFLPIADGE